MDLNGQRRTADYWIKVLSDPSVRAAERLSLAEWRRKRVIESLKTRPVFLPLQYTLAAAGTTSPYRDITPQLGYDVVITGAKTNIWPGNGRNINISLTDGSGNFVRNNNVTDLFLRSDDLAGCTIDAGGGEIGVFYWPQPYLLRQGSRLSVEVFKTDTTAATEPVNITLIGFRVLPTMVAQGIIDYDEQLKIDQAIALREAPVTRFLKIPVTFPAATVGSQVANIESPRVEEPILLRGLRTNMRNSTIELGVDGEANWMTEQTPIWGVSAPNEGVTDNYMWFTKPVYLKTNNMIPIRRAINGNIDQSNVDPATGNEITVIYDTV